MKVQLHNNEVRPLIKEGYEKVYDALHKLLSPEEFIFAEWKAGFGDILQWTLPNDISWRNLASADSFDRQAVIEEFLRLKAIGEAKLGKNKRLIESVYSVPSEASVYYAIEPNGHYRIMLTGWGYAFPYQTPITILSATVNPANQRVTIRFTENNSPAAALPFEILREGNRTLHFTADINGEKTLGSLLPGSRLGIAVPSADKRFFLDVVKGKEFYTFDITALPKAEIPQIEVPPMPEPPAAPPTKEEPAEEMQEEITEGRNRDISIRFIGHEGYAVTNCEAVLSQAGAETIAEGIDNNGYIYLDKRDFLPNKPITINLNSATTYPEAVLTIDPSENEYEVMFRHKTKSNLWLELLMWFGALIVAAGAFYLMLNFNKIM